MHADTPTRFGRLLAGGGLFLVGAGLTALALGALSPKAGATLVQVLPYSPPAAAPVPASFETRSAAARAPHSGRESYADILEPAMRAVVNIQSTRKSEPGRRMPQLPDIFPWHVPVPDQPQEDQEDRESLGSGVIVRSDGIVLTNNHVVEGASEVLVTLADKRELRAKVLGTDPATDIAVLKIEDGVLPTLPFGTSSNLRVGDVVFAIGSPFGLSQTATMGIVSAMGRSNLGITRMNDGRGSGYENFIQTDAAINMGNSGGALIDADGKLVGINTAIYSRGSSGNQGIGFTVPIDQARNVMDQIITDGHVVRSRLGVQIKPVDAALAKSYGLARPEGALVVSVVPESPAARAGIRPEDVIVALDGRPVEDDSSLRLDVSSRRPGTKIEVGLLRDGSAGPRPMNVTATLEEMRDENEPEPTEVAERGATEGALRGIVVDDLEALNARQRERLGLSALSTGVLVTDVLAGSPAARAGLRAGDLIVQVNREAVGSVDDFKRLSREKGKDIVRLKLQRGEQTDIIAVEP